MDLAHVTALENIHKQLDDIDLFLTGVAEYLKSNKITDEVFFAWWDSVDLSDEPSAPFGPSFLNDLVQFADDWDFYMES